MSRPWWYNPDAHEGVNMRGHLVIADISGYTRFLTDSELDHANGIVADLLNSIVDAMQTPLAVSNIEGDAVFMYGEMADGMSGQTILESVELIYCAFASALENMVLNTTCQCNACVNISSLGLKIVMHCGEYAKSTVGTMTTLSGPDVIAVHRLLKNQVIEDTGIEDYLLITRACVDDLGVESIVKSWIPHTEEYDHIGRVDGYVSSLRDVFEFLQRQTEVKVLHSDAWAEVREHTAAPPAVVWDHIIDPRKRMQWLDAHGMDVHGAADGRVAPGTEFHCAHGDNELVIFTILDMRPYEYITVIMQFTEESVVKYTTYLIPSGSGTRILLCAEAPRTLAGGEFPEQSGTEYSEAYSGLMEGAFAVMTQLTDGIVESHAHT
jgi:uncharacterized protein YndB with AHSA1/START domain